MLVHLLNVTGSYRFKKLQKKDSFHKTKLFTQERSSFAHTKTKSSLFPTREALNSVQGKELSQRRTLSRAGHDACDRAASTFIKPVI